MRRTGTVRLAAAALGGLVLLGIPAPSSAQRTSPPLPSSGGEGATSESGSIRGVVRDEHGTPIRAAIVSAIGATSAFAVTDRDGRFVIPALVPGAYTLRAHRAGYAAAPQGGVHHVLTGAAASVLIALQRTDDGPLVLAAGFGTASQPSDHSDHSDHSSAPEADQPPAADATPVDTTEKAWRLRHARRSILREMTMTGELVADADPGEHSARTAGSAARLATSFFAEFPLSGQVHFLTTGSFDAPRDLFSAGTLSRGITYLRVGAPVGSVGDWTVRGAVTESDISAWILAGAYETRAPAQHRYDVGLSYSTQRYDGGNPLALREVTDGSRNVGTVYAFDTFSLTPALSVTYGGRYAQYDYLEHRGLFSPSVEIEVDPENPWRFSASLSRQAQAPGAEEFLPPGDSGIWLPPQRTFSSLEPGQPLKAERMTDLEFTVEREIAASRVAVRAFRHHVDDQLVTVFGASIPFQPESKLGHYFVGNAGNLDAVGGGAIFNSAIFHGIQGSVAYSTARVAFTPAADVPYMILLAPSAVRSSSERIHDLAGSIEAEVPETSTRVLVLYRLSNAYAHAHQPGVADRPGFDRRFDVQVRQSLPFLESTSAKLEMLIAVRNFFREATADQSLYDELLAIRPPKRIVGGVTLHF